MQEISSHNVKIDGVDTNVRILWDEELIFVAMSGEKKLGEFSLDYDASGVLYIQHMAVNQEYQQQGIGTLILNEIINKYDDEVAKYYLKIGQDRDGAHLSLEGAEFLSKYFKKK